MKTKQKSQIGKLKCLGAVALVLALTTGCLSVVYQQDSDRLNQTETTRITARGLFKDTSLAGVLGATEIKVSDTNGATYSSARNIGATNVATVVSTNTAKVLESAGIAAGNVIGEAVGAAVKP